MKVVIPAPSNPATQTKVGGAVRRKLTYDGAGDLTGDQTLGGTNYGYVYNAAARLTAVQKAVSPPVPFGAYGYDFVGQRVWRQTFGSGAGQTAYVHDEAGHVLAEQDAVSGAAVLEYIWLDDRLIGMVTFSGGIPTTRFVTTGQIDEPLLVTQNNQATYWSGYLDPFGNAATFGTALSRLNLRFPGQWFQAEASASGLHQNGWRDYDPSLGRYLEADPLGIDAGTNVYGYVYGDPLNFSDQEGLEPSCAYYSIACSRTGNQSRYYCGIAQLMCNAHNLSPFLIGVPQVKIDKIRQCLIQSDKNAVKDQFCGPKSCFYAPSDNTVNAYHKQCYKQCGVSPSRYPGLNPGVELGNGTP